jgi:hypothetical protein
MQIKISAKTPENYINDLKNGKIILHPELVSKCPCCNKPNCLKKHSSYKRWYYDRQGILSIIIILVFRCSNKKIKHRKCYSLFPSVLIPYRWNTIKQSITVVNQFIKSDGNMKNTIDKLSEYSDLGSMFVEFAISKYYSIIALIKMSYKKYQMCSDKEKPVCSSFEDFIKLCSQYKYRKAEELSLNYYRYNGGVNRNSQFLFGTPFQFRLSP